MLNFLKIFDNEVESQLVEIQSAIINNSRNNKLRKEITRRFLSSLLTDDERAALYNLPEGCRIRENAKIINQEKLKCGKYVWIGEGAMIDASGGLEIGDHTTIGGGVFIWTHHSTLASLNGCNTIGSQEIIRRASKIGEKCYIVGHAVINPGITIENGSVILPMSVVTKNVKSGSIMAGSPAKCIGTADEAFKERIRKFIQSTNA